MYIDICCLDPDHDYFSQALVKDSLALCVLVHLAATTPEVFVMSIRVVQTHLIALFEPCRHFPGT